MLRMKIPDVDVMLPVPLHRRKLRQREFNQSALFVRYLSKYTGIPAIFDCLIKVRDTMPQVELSAEQRRKNLRNAFEVSDKGLIHGKDLLLVDDVLTTGATVRECSRILKKAGAKGIYVITLASAT